MQKENTHNMKLFGLLAVSVTLIAQTYTFSDGGKRARMEFAPNEAYLTVKPGSDRKAAIAKARQAAGEQTKAVGDTGGAGFLMTFHGPAREAVKTLRKSKMESIQSAAPVFYDATVGKSARYSEGSRRILTEKLLVRMGSEEQWNTLRESTGASARKESVLKGWWLVEYADAYAALDAVETLTKSGSWEFAPVFARQWTKRQASGPLKRTVNDPLFVNQWHFANEVPGLQMNATWDIATGKGINISVVDDGLDVAHDDLAANAYPVSSGNHKNFNGGPADDPTPSEPGQNHGTGAAGLIAAVGFNNLGVVGVAPEARLMGLRLIAEPSGDDAAAEAMLWQPNGLVQHVSSNSWGAADDGKNPGRIGPLQMAAMEKAATTYRNGLGTVFVVSAGNGRDAGDSSNYDAFAGNRYSIGVAAINRKASFSSYSEAGINVAISALGGEMAPPDMMWTLNVSGDAANAQLKSKFETSQAPVDYSDAYNGTSAAAPQVSGAAALLLQVNPNLSYRDVKEILMKTAAKNGLQGEEFRTNGGGFSFSNDFGAGLMNVSAAVDAAATWKPLGPLTKVELSVPDVKAIPDGSIDGATYSFDFSKQANLRVETVEVEINVEHKKRGDIGLIITSPSGMRSIVEPRPGDDGENFEGYVFTSVQNWGENSTGTWTVRIVDINGNGIAGRAGDVAVRIYGTAK